MPTTETIITLVFDKSNMPIPVPVRAYRVGEFLAVHREVVPTPTRWVITHVPTGWRFGGEIGYWPTRRSALEWARLLDGPEWKFSSPKKVPRLVRSKWENMVKAKGNPWRKEVKR